MKTAFLFGKVTPSTEYKILEGLYSLKCIEYANLIYGSFDVVIKVNAESLEELDKLIQEEVRRISGLEFTKTLFVGKTAF